MHVRRGRRPDGGRGAAGNRADRPGARADRARRRRVLGTRAGRQQRRRPWGHRARTRRRRSRRTPRTTCSCSTAGRSCPWCSSSNAAEATWSSTRPTGSSISDAHRRLLDLPRLLRTARWACRCSGARARRGRPRRPGARPSSTRRDDRHRRSTTRPTGAGPGMVMMPAPLFAAVEASRRAAPAVPALRERAALRPGGAHGSLPPGAGFSLAVRPLRGSRPAGRRPPLRRRAVGGRLRARGRRGCGAGRDRRGRPAGAGRDGQRGVGPRRVVRRRAARVPAVHASGRVPGPLGPRGAPHRRPRARRPLAPGGGACAARSSGAPI